MTNILLIYPGMIPSVRLCALEPLLHLKNKGKIKLQHIPISRMKTKHYLWCDMAIFVRSDSELDIYWAEKMRRSNKYIIYILDDDLLNIATGLSVSKYYQRKEVKSSIKKLISLSDRFLSPSPELISKYGGDSKKSALIEEPSLYLKENPVFRMEQRPVKIGFAGSIDREGDLNQLLDDVVGEISSKYGDLVKFEFFGARPKFIEKFSLTYYRYEGSYQAYQNKMNELNWDIGLAPLPDTPFHNCKHYNKFIEYSSFGVVGVYSNVNPYTRIVKSYENGILCANNKQQWVEALSNLIENPDILGKMRENAFNQVKDGFSLEAISRILLQAEPEIESYHSPREIEINYSYKDYILYVKKKAEFFIRKLFYFVQKHKYKTPVVLIRKIINKFKH